MSTYVSWMSVETLPVVCKRFFSVLLERKPLAQRIVRKETVSHYRIKW